MKQYRIVLLTFSILIAVLLTVCCGKKEESSEPELLLSFIGRWTCEEKYNQNGDKVTETTAIIFYFSGRYRWIYTYYLNDQKDESRSYEKQGAYELTETNITFTADDGEVKNCTYELTGRSDVLLIINDGQGKVWNFTDYFKSRYETY